MGVNISCVIPKYNGGPWFFNSLKTLRAQSHPFSQIVVSDDNSTDGSLDQVRALDGVDNIKVVVPATRQPGMGANIAYALDHLDGSSDYTLVGSVDDYWDVDFCKTLAREVEKVKGERPISLFTDRWIMDENDRLTGASGSLKHPLRSTVAEWNYHAAGCRYIIHGALFETKFLLSIRELLRSTGQSADWFMIAEAARHGSIAYVPLLLFKFRVHSGSTSATRKDWHKASLGAYRDYLQRNAPAECVNFVQGLIDRYSEGTPGKPVTGLKKLWVRDQHGRGKLRLFFLGFVSHYLGLRCLFFAVKSRLGAV